MSFTMGDTTAAIVWGIPVKPLDLLCNLDSFRKAIPVIRTLRLCNQFGKGEDAGITKLPKELIEFIEEELLASLRQDKTGAGRGRTRKYACFEGTCRPSDHMDKAYMDGELEEVKFDLLDAHPEWQTEDGYELPENYDDLLKEEVANHLDTYPWDCFWEVCYDNKSYWQSVVRKHMEKDGNSDVLRKHFGLDVFIMHENLDADTIKYLERTDSRYTSGGSDTEKATICYLTLPSRTAQWETRLDSASRDSGYYHGESASSMLVDPSSLTLTEGHQRRFARAMLRLALQPSVHPSQLQKDLSATSTIGGPPSPTKVSLSTSNTGGSRKDNAKEDTVTTSRINNLEQSQWPKLMLLASHTYSDP